MRTYLAWCLPMKAALERLKGLPLPTGEDVTTVVVSLMRVLLWLPERIMRVFLGTYVSHNEDVRRAGLVADVSALALAGERPLLLYRHGPT